MDKKSLRKLKSRLPFSFLNELAERSGMSKSTCTKTMSGIRDSKPVIDAAITWAEEIENEELIRKQKINNLCSLPA